MLQVIAFNTIAQQREISKALNQPVFIENKGQWDDEVLFLARQGGLNIWITKFGLTYDYFKIAPKKTGDKRKQHEVNGERSVVVVKYENSREVHKGVQQKIASGYHNYFVGQDKRRWAKQVKLSESVLIPEIYPGIDVRYYFENSNLRYDFIVHPGSSVNDIGMSFQGIENLRLNQAGDFVYSMAFGEVKNARLYAYQTDNNVKHQVECRFLLEGDKVKLDLGQYDKRKELIIDPLVFSTYIGAGDEEYGTDIELDNLNNMYTCGGSWSIGYPTTAGAYPFVAWADGVVTKLSSSNCLLYSTYFGGDHFDWFYDIDVNQTTGQAWLTGQTHSYNIPITTNAYNPTFWGNSDVMIVSFNTSGGLDYSTYLGQTEHEGGQSIAALYPSSSTTDLIVSGYTTSVNFPTTAGAYNQTNNGGTDAFALRLSVDATQTSLTFSTLIGGNQTDFAIGMDIDAAENIYLVGQTGSLNFPGNLIGTFYYDLNCFVCKLNSTGSTLVFSNRFGGDQVETCKKIKVTTNSEVYFVGESLSTNLPVTSGTNFGGQDIFVGHLSSNGNLSELVFLGGSMNEFGEHLALHAGEVYVAGTSLSSDYPTTPCAYDLTISSSDGVLTKLDANLTNILYSTFLGGTDFDFLQSLAIDNTGLVYMTGGTASTDYPLANACYSTLSGQPYNDVFVTVLDLSNPLVVSASSNSPVCGGQSLQLNAVGATTFQWLGPNTNVTTTSTSLTIPNVNPSYSGVYTVTVTDANGCSATSSVNVLIYPAFTASIQSATSNGAPCGPGDLLGFPSPGNYTYTWTDPIGGVTTNVNTNGYGAALIGTYTLVVTDANGCTSSATYTIFNQPTVTASSSAITTLCANTPITLSAAPQNYPSYNWLPGTGLNQAVVTAYPSGPTTYTVTIVDANGCTATSTTFVNTLPQKFCCSQAAINISNNTSTILLDNQDANYLANYVGNSTLNGLTLFINGTFTLNQSMQWNDCRVYFTENAKIMINPGQVLDIQQNSELSSPDDCPMWDGIYASGTGAQLITQGNANITTGHNIIRDMINGVQISLNAKLTSSLTHYDDNKLSISLIDLPANYNGTIEKNTFKYQNGLKAPYTGDKPQTGITVSNSLNVVIGSPNVSGNGNSFDGLHNGIYLTYYQPNPFTAPPAVVNMHHNVFTNILGGINLWDVVSPNSTQTLYNDLRGCAILGINRRQQYHVTANIYGNSMPTNTLNNFTNCNKAVILNGFHTTIYRNTTFNTQAGFLNAQCDGKSISVSKNKLVGARLGISKVGDEANFDVNDNELSMADPYPTQAGLYVPLAINSTYITAQNTGTTDIFSNYIDFSHPDYGTGIHLLNGSRDFIRNNQIDFLYSGNDPSATTVPNLFGMDLSNNDGVHVFANYVLGLNAPNFLNLRRAAGINMHKNKSSLVECNTLSNLQFGLHVVGDNNCNNYDRVRHNTLNNQNYGILLRHLSNEATLGNLGEFIPSPYFAYDANNLFQGAMQAAKVHRITPCTFQTSDKIVTQQSNIQQFESTSSQPGNNCRYIVPVVSIFNEIFECTPDLIEEPILGNIDRAELIALENSEYLEYEEGGRWLDERMVMEWLNKDPDLRLNSPILNNYYLAHQQHALQYLYEIDQLLAALASINVMQNPTLWQQEYQSALALNQTINGSNLFETNEKTLNGLYLNYLGSGMESLTTENLLWIETLAQKCPYLDGQAVFKARTLYAMLVGPKTYNDLQICNTVGIYKGSQSWYEQENASLFQHGKDQVGSLQVFPNPGLDFVTFKLTEPNLLLQSVRIYNMAGQQVLEDTQLNQSGIKRMDIKNLIQGLYTYQCVDSNGLVYTGKLIKY
jgi:hypothetical protein